MTPRRAGAERAWDIVAVVLIVAGLALYFWVHVTLGDIGDDVVVLTGEPGSAVATVNRLRHTGTAAIALIVVGVLVGLWSYVRHGRRRLQSTR